MPAKAPFALMAAAASLVMSPALAEQAASSVYTKFDSRSCRHKPGVEDEDYGSWTCKGLGGRAIILTAGDQRMQVAFGKQAPGDLAGTQTFPGFNNVYEGTVEWRLDAAKKPFATILRWNVMRAADMKDGPSESKGRVLVVTRLGPGGSCHVGYVDARTNPDANALARQLADDEARAFRCGTDKATIVGKTDPEVDMPDGS